MTEYLVYRMDFPNGKSYIGARWAGPLDTYWTSSKLVANYINKHGTDGITKTVLCRCADRKNCLLVERVYHIANNVAKNPKFYNTTIFYGDDTFHKNRKVWNKGLTKENDPRVATYSKKLTGRKHTAQARAKMSVAKTGTTCTFTKQHRANISKARKGHKISEACVDAMSKSVEINFVYGTILFPSRRKACEFLGLKKLDTISRWIRGKKKPQRKRQITGIRFVEQEVA